MAASSNFSAGNRIATRNKSKLAIIRIYISHSQTFRAGARGTRRLAISTARQRLVIQTPNFIDHPRYLTGPGTVASSAAFDEQRRIDDRARREREALKYEIGFRIPCCRTCQSISLGQSRATLRYINVGYLDNKCLDG